MPQRISIDLSPAQLEVEVRRLLDSLFSHRGLTVKHNGTSRSHAPGGLPDMEMYNEDVHITVEVTKLLRVSQSNNEATPVPAHLDSVVSGNPAKECYALFVSPETFRRSADLFANYNHRYSNQKDRKIASVSFGPFNLVAEWLGNQEVADFTVSDWVDLIRGASTYQSDEDVLGYLNDNYIKAEEIDKEIIRVRRDRLASKYSQLDSIFGGIHNDLRGVSGLGPPEAFNELSKLVFLKMYEEQQVHEESLKGRIVDNRFTTAYIQSERKRRRTRGARHPIIELFDEVRREYEEEALFELGEQIVIDSGKDQGNLIDSIVGRIEDYSFIDPELPVADIKGMIYEQFLGLSLRNTDLGQFFTPDAVIDFMVQLAELSPRDKVLDPACGTGRFLVHAMNDMVQKAGSPQQRSSILKNKLIGIEKSGSVSKIARMNMFVHGDGRTNIHNEDSLSVDVERLGPVDVILTNPPLGEINFRKIFGGYDGAGQWYERMEVIPKRRTKPKRAVPKTYVSLSSMKGGALFLNVFLHLLRPGGVALTVIDEAVLNTDELAHTRLFLRSHFDVVAVISLTEDTFKHASKTATKTSVLMIRKRRPGDPRQPRPSSSATRHKSE